MASLSRPPPAFRPDRSRLGQKFHVGLIAQFKSFFRQPPPVPLTDQQSVPDQFRHRSGINIVKVLPEPLLEVSSQQTFRRSQGQKNVFRQPVRARQRLPEGFRRLSRQLPTAIGRYVLGVGKSRVPVEGVGSDAEAPIWPIPPIFQVVAAFFAGPA